MGLCAHDWSVIRDPANDAWFGTCKRCGEEQKGTFQLPPKYGAPSAYSANIAAVEQVMEKLKMGVYWASDRWMAGTDFGSDSPVSWVEDSLYIDGPRWASASTIGTAICRAALKAVRSKRGVPTETLTA